MSARWRYILQEAAIGLRRNLMMTFAVILSVAVSLTLLGAFLLLRDQVGLATGEWFDKIEVSIFLCDGNKCPEITDAQRNSLEQDILAEPVVASVFYESKEDAYAAFREQYRNEPDLVDSVSPDILPAAFRVKLHNPDQFEVIRDRFEAYPGVEDIIDQRELLSSFLQFTDLLQGAAIIVAVIQLIAASVLVGNTIRVAAFARREQTSIMKLVGASNWYIRLPFVVEGVIAGLAGAVVSWVLMLIAVPWATRNLRESIDIFPFIGLNEAIAVGPALILFGVGISGVASVLALRRFLDV